MPKKIRYFIMVSHCLLNPMTRVHMLGKGFGFSRKIIDYFLDKHISIIQLPCPEFTAMGYLRNPQGRQQYDNIFFKKHCRKELQSYVDMVCELKNNNINPLCYIGIQGSPTCSIYWGKHKVNRYMTESMVPDLNGENVEETYGVMTAVLDDMLKEQGINIPYLEVPVKENINSEKSVKFFNSLYELFDVPEKYRDIKKFLED